MEIAAILIAIIGLLALSGGGRVSGGVNVAPISTLIPPSQAGPLPYSGFAPSSPIYTPGVTVQQTPTWSPTPAPPFQPPMVPTQSTNITGTVFTGAASVGTSVATQAVKNTAGAAVSLGTAAATAGIAAGVAILASVVTSLLQAHQARLRGATNENQAADTYVPVFDSFVQQVVAAYNSGQGTAAQVASACQQFDMSLYNAMHALVGAPGTAWSDTVGKAGQCNSSCTVSCCLYWQDLSVVLNDISYVLGYPTGKWGAGDPRISGRTVTAPKVFPSKYSPYTRASYTVTLK